MTKSLEAAGSNPDLVTTVAQLAHATAIVVPGQGPLAIAQRISRSGMWDAIIEWIKPVALPRHLPRVPTAF